MQAAFAFLFVAAALILGGCASAPADSTGQTPSTIPWNQPASWEGGGPAGSALGK